MDDYGDKVCAANLNGGGNKTRHDDIKNFLHRLMKWAGMTVQCEVYGLFAADIPQAALARIDQNRKRQGIIPDFMLPSKEGGNDSTLADVKFITGTVTRYPRNPGPLEEPKKAVNRRAALVHTEYYKKAIKLDVKFNGIQRAKRGQVQQAGPVQHRLARYGEVEGWCFGVFGEASDQVHNLLHEVVEERLKIADQKPGRRKVRSTEAKRAKLQGSLRQQLSLLTVRANARNIVSRVENFVGQGCTEAANRRKFVDSEERRQVRQRRAQALTTAQGWSLIARGSFRI